MLLIASFMAIRAWTEFRDHSRHLWTSGIHDRNAHYSFALSLALDVTHGDLKELRHDLNSARVWGPLHGILLSAVLLVGPLDYHLAILPSLLGWVAAAVLAFVLARRMLPQGGNVAGAVAAGLFLVSPAHQAFATDVMLESLGACLTLLALYLYVRQTQEPSRWCARCFALAVTALFFHKYNYWLLVLFAVIANEIITRGATLWPQFRDWFRRQPWSEYQRAELRNPLNYLILILLGLALWIAVSGGTVLNVGGREISVRTPHNMIHVAYVLGFVRLLLWWKRSLKEQVQSFPLRERQFVYWHLWPVAIWFLLPKRLGYFLWYLSPAQQGERAPGSLTEGVAEYWNSIIADYHLGLWSVLLVIGLMAMVFLTARRLRTGATVLLCFVLISIALTINHPNRKSRFLHSWLPVTWVLAGVGVAQLARLRLLTKKGDALRPWLAGVAALGVIVAHAPGFTKPGRAPEGGVRQDRASLLEVAEAYLPELEGSKRVAILCNVPLKFFSEWTYLQRYGGTRNVVTELNGYDPQRTAWTEEQLTQWFGSLKQDRIVLFDVPPKSYFYVDVTPTDYVPLREQLKKQKAFVLQKRIDFQKYGCAVEVWKRRAD